ncbi:MAG: ergothioneine biosynthesis protein EgtB [Acidimicrobiia bacterium]
MTTHDRPPHDPTTTVRARGGDEERAALRVRFRSVRDLTESLAAPLRPEDQVVQSMPDVSPTKWHRGHTTWFFETFLLEPQLTGYDMFDLEFRYLFNSYYETVGPRHPRNERGLVSRPNVEEVGCYRAHVDAAMEKLIDCYDSEWLDFAALVELGLHHEQQHQELLLMDIKHVLSCNPLEPAYVETSPPIEHRAQPMRFVDCDGGLIEAGHSGSNFAFDNESPRHKVYLEPFRLADRLVTAGEWMEFIADGAYHQPELWLSDGWYAVQEHGWNAPAYWRCDDNDGWSSFTLNGRRQIHSDEPVVHVSHYEADAFARWAGARLPTEFEWEHAVSCRDPHDVGSKARPSASLIESVPSGVRLQPAAAPAGSGLRQAFGDAWQWTASAYLPYPRFAPAPGAVGEYNGKFMSGQMVLRGSACITPAGHARATYRNFFPPSSRWMFAGLRLASDT